MLSLATKPCFLHSALACALRRPSLALTLPRMLLAYRTGALQSRLLWLEAA